MFIYCFPVPEEIATANTNNLALNIVGRKLKQVKTIKPPAYPWSLKLIDGDIWCCQNDGILVYDIALTPLRRIDTGCANDVAIRPGGNVVIAGSALCEMSKSGTENDSLKCFTWYNNIA